ncbi:MAG: hypothetical protein H7Y42_01745 [Chitinophagaceae bacterium]|nr:hypothetical protein [Chitinophagaceae bacterium]
MNFAFAILVFAGILQQQLFVNGKLRVHRHEGRHCVFSILVKEDDKVLAATTVDSTGRFQLRFSPSADKDFDFYYIDSHHASDTIFLKSYPSLAGDSLDVTLYTFKGVMRVDENDKVTCPKCRKSNEVSKLELLPGYYYCAKDKIKF